MKKFVVGFILFSVVIFLVIKKVDFKGGIILGEPDEFVHVNLVRSLLQKGKPMFQEKGFYYEMPGYFFLGALFTKFFSLTPIVSLRFVSFLATLGTAGLIFFYLLKKDSINGAYLGGFLYLFTPLAVFFSRVGIIEPLLVFFLAGTVVFFDLGLENQDRRHLSISGIFLGLALLTKYSVLPVFFLMILFFLHGVLRDNSFFWRKEFFKVKLTSLLPIILSLFLFLPVLFYLYEADPVTLKDQTKQVFGLTGEVKAELRLERISDFYWWFSTPIILLATLGFITSLKNIRRNSFIIFSLLIMVLAVITRLPFYSRYALVLTPLLVIMAARGGLFLGRVKLWWVALVLVPMLNVDSVYEAWRASRSDFMETAINQALMIKPQARWLFSNYWPNILASIGGIKNYSWLTLDSSDLRSFAPKENTDALEILRRDGGLVMIEDVYVKYFLTSKEGRDKALDQIVKNNPPIFTLENSGTNFPNLRLKGDKLKVYIF